MHIAALPLVAVFLCAGSAWSLPPTVITFEDLPGDTSAVPDGYFGFDWENIHNVDGSQAPYANSGYDNGRVSGDIVAYNNFANPAATLRITGNPFTFIGAWFTGAWNNGLSITVEGYLNGSLDYTTTFMVDTTGPTFQALNYVNVDELRFRSFGGVPQPGLGGEGTHFVMDDFTFAPIPEPSTLVLCVSGILGAVSVARSRVPKAFKL
jgi:hypothetical protein